MNRSNAPSCIASRAHSSVVRRFPAVQTCSAIVLSRMTRSKSASGIAVAGTMPGHHGAGSSDMQEMMQQHHARMNGPAAAGPAIPGQAAFGAVQEIVPLTRIATAVLSSPAHRAPAPR